jgi:PST family polysaccharide transporter
MLSGSSAVTIVGGVVAARTFAALIGASGVGLMSVLQSALTIATIVAGMGVGAGVVQSGASALSRGDALTLAAIRRAAWLLTALLAAAGFVVLVVFRASIVSAVTGDATRSDSIVFVAIALVFTLLWTIETSILNAHHFVRTLAKIAVFKGSIGMLAGIGVVWMWRERGIAPALAAMAVVNWTASRYFVSRAWGRERFAVARAQVAAAARMLLRFGLPFTASTLAGTGVQYLIPILVLQKLGVEAAGFYGAAATIALGYVGFFLNILAQDYYPRVSAARDDAVALTALINEQHRVLMIAGLPVVLGLIAMARVVVSVVYAPAFAPAADILEWQLTGDLLRFSSWTMSFAILARNGSVVFLLTELAGGLTLLVASWWCVQSFGLSGIGMAFLITALVHFLVVSVVVRRDIGLVWTAANRNLIVIAVLAGLVLRLLGLAGWSSVRTLIALASVGLSGLYGVRFVRREMLLVRDAPTP